MDARSVLSIIPLLDEKIMGTLGQNGISRLLSENKDIITDTGQEYLLSMTTKNSIHTIYQLLSWYNRQKINYDLNVIKKSLFQLENWEIDAYSIKSSQKTFSVIGVAVSAGTREVNHWMQPLLKDQNIGLNVFFIKKIGGVIHFLIQARVEAGVKDIIELYPTISCFNYNNIISEMEKPFLFDEIFNPTNIIHYDSIQSEEGGRFFQIQNRNMIIQADFDDDKIPSNYIWVTLRQINEFIRYGLFGIEARSLLSAISFI
jgi:oxidase EvaA